MLVGLVSETERNLLKPPAFGGFVFNILAANLGNTDAP